MIFGIHYECGIKTIEKSIFNPANLAFHIVWRHIFGTGKVKSFPNNHFNAAYIYPIVSLSGIERYKRLDLGLK